LTFGSLEQLEKVNYNIRKFWDQIIEEINRVAEEKKLNIRYISLFELQNISINSRKSLNKLREEALKEKKG
jgi:hypothetical protein